jgi:hypothetical protein
MANGPWGLLAYLLALRFSNPLGRGALSAHPLGRGARVLGCWGAARVPGFLGEGVGPTDLMARLRRHHESREIF